MDPPPPPRPVKGMFDVLFELSQNQLVDKQWIAGDLKQIWRYNDVAMR